MPHNPRHRCDDCDVLLSRHYPYSYCPKHWRQRYNAPPGKYLFDYLDAAAKLVRDIPTNPSNTGSFFPGGTKAASRD